MRFARAAAFAGIALSWLVLPLMAQAPSDWRQWRGAARDGAVEGFAVPEAWPENLTPRWKVEVGEGYATPIVVGDRIYMWSRRGDREVMSALDAATGKELWQTGYTALFTMRSAAARHGPGPKSTPIYEDGRLYAIGMTGVVTAFDAATGKQIWQKPGSDLMPTFTTHAFSPLVDGGLVAFHVGGHDQGALTALDVGTGEVKWGWAGDGPGYGSPIIATFDGTRQLVTITQRTLVSVDPATGTVLWEQPYVSPNDTNTTTPMVSGETLIVSGNQGPTTGLSVRKRDGKWGTETLWQNADVPMRLSDAVVADGVLYGMTTRNSGQYFAVDAATGKTLWTSDPRQADHAAISRSGEFLLILEDDGELLVARTGRTAFQEVRRYKVADSATWTPAVYSGNRVFVKDVTHLALWTLD